MQYGVCGGLEMAAVARSCGYDFLEATVGGILKPDEPEAAFEDVLHKVEALPLPLPALNCLVPGRLPLTGPQVDLPAIEAYLQVVFRRAQRAGIRVLVFGSGGARRIPDGFDPAAAWAQLVAFGRRLAELGAAHGVTVVVEPLNRKETNVITTVAEGAALVRAVDQPALRLLVDGYHWLLDGDRAEDIVANGRLLAHAHIATAPRRLPPGAEPCDLAPFFAALARAGYDGRLTFEGSLEQAEQRLPAALAQMRRLAQDAAQ